MKFRFADLSKAASFVVPIAIMVACGSSSSRGAFDGKDGKDAGETSFGDADIQGDGAVAKSDADPKTCDEAREAKTYVGCDYWPTVTGNLVADVFDFAVAVANVGTEDAEVTVTGPGGVNKKATVAAGTLEKIYLPWVTSLKGSAKTGLTASVVAKGGAYHLVSDRPVVVYQFNPLEFEATGGEPGKDWSSCVPQLFSDACYSYSNDASLLLPSTAMTGNYRIMGTQGFSRHMDPDTGEIDPSYPLRALGPAYFVVTATEDNTSVTVKLSSKGSVVAGGSIKATPGGGTLTFVLNAGDVAEVASESGNAFDFSGSLLTADKPVQVITGVSCMDEPLDTQACDHIEETVFPAETLGKHYVVPRPTGPAKNDVGHVVRFYGNADGTTLTYTPSKPAGCPDSLSAGELVECGVVNIDFEVEGSNEFGIGVFQLGGEKADPNFDPSSLAQPQGDPSQSFAVTVEQYRKRYVFLAPADYKTNYVDVVAPEGTELTLDGDNVSNALKPIKGTSWYLGRVDLSTSGKDGVHVLEGDKPIGIQVIGYGDNTSYQYPGGLNLGTISAPPIK
ncbi:hemagglutinin/hemolysin-related protein [Labilithrix luteola]|uniref:Hemagglutinin/hemolysin-related protein n=1 Tax=Labilithrix luteola TaxID=1391654 RepID=A0A0K1PWW4_9BACT|nr:IgGFc-binding protein [Labilithrix luteola]AKU98007.1 hemagglutinin/hemolysin-related protein [Labilithrix luteola]